MKPLWEKFVDSYVKYHAGYIPQAACEELPHDQAEEERHSAPVESKATVSQDYSLDEPA